MRELLAFESSIFRRGVRRGLSRECPLHRMPKTFRLPKRILGVTRIQMRKRERKGVEPDRLRFKIELLLRAHRKMSVTLFSHMGFEIHGCRYLRNRIRVLALVTRQNRLGLEVFEDRVTAQTSQIDTDLLFAFTLLHLS